MDRHDRRRLSDEELAERARSGDSRSFAELWERHVRPGRTAAGHFASIADPDDIVAEAYLRILRAVQQGGGPHEAFRPYLYRTIRNVALSWQTTVTPVPLEDAEDRADDTFDLESTVLDNTITVRAFRALPERWQTVLWYTEVEGMDTAEAAPLLGLTAGGAAALAYRARDGLKKAWLQAHVSDLRVPPDCRWTTERMGEYARGGLTVRSRERFASHLKTCTRCSILLEEVDQIGGRLAGFLLPAVLGGTVGTLVLADLAGNAHAASAAAAAVPSVPRGKGSPQVIAVAAATVLVLGGIAAGVAAANGVFTSAETQTASPDLPSTSVTPKIPTPDVTPTPRPTVPPAPPAPPVAPLEPVTPVPPSPVAPVPPPLADTAAPPAPAIISPANGDLSAQNRPIFVGSGEPGARVELSTTAGTLIAAGPVGATGSWTATTTAPLPDGTIALLATQIDAAGNRSTPATVTLVVDTIALPPTLDPLADPLLYLPVVTGTGEPSATVEVLDELGITVGTAVADAAGAWAVALPDPERDGSQLSARQIDSLGNVSAPSAPLAPLVFERPTILTPTAGESVATPSVSVELSGVPGRTVEILIDDVPTGNVHVLQAAPITRITPPLPPGPHTIRVRYYESVERVGSTAGVAFTVQ